MGPALEFQVICLKLENSCRENEDVAFVVWFPFVKNTKSGFAFQKKTLNTTLHCYLLFIQKTSPPPPLLCCFPAWCDEGNTTVPCWHRYLSPSNSDSGLTVLN